MLRISSELAACKVGMAGQQRKRLQAARPWHLKLNKLSFASLSRLAMSVALAAMPDTKLGDTFKRPLDNAVFAFKII